MGGQNLRGIEMIKVAVATPSVGMMRTRYAVSLLRMYDYFIRTPILGLEDEPKQLGYLSLEGSMVYSGREKFVDDVVNGDYTHLLFIDDDMGFREDSLNILLSRQVPIVAVNYRMKVPPCHFTARKLDNSGWIETNPQSDSLEEALFSGFGMCLMERQVLEKIAKPRFLPQYEPETQSYSTEDYTFFQKTREAGFPLLIDHKVSKRVYHIGNWFYSYDDSFPEYLKNPAAERAR